MTGTEHLSLPGPSKSQEPVHAPDDPLQFHFHVFEVHDATFRALVGMDRIFGVEGLGFRVSTWKNMEAPA